MAKCGARNTTPPYGICKRPVLENGDRCHDHEGLPQGGPRPNIGRSRPRRSSSSKSRSRSKPARSVSYPDHSWHDELSAAAPSPAPVARPPIPRPRRPPRRRKRADNLTEREQQRVDRAVAFCLDIGFDGWEKTVAGRVTDCLTPRTWNRLFRGRRKKDCKFLADLAKLILEGKQKLHEIIGRFGGWIAGRLGAEPLERTVARELAQRIPIPVVDEKAIVVARGLQMIGILLCLSRDIPLNRCQSFIDLSLAETKVRVKQILVAAMEDWTRPSDAMIATWSPRRNRGTASGSMPVRHP